MVGEPAGMQVHGAMIGWKDKPVEIISPFAGQSVHL